MAARNTPEPEMQSFYVTVPANIQPGQRFCARIGTNGPLLQVTCPDNGEPGMTLLIKMPNAPQESGESRLPSRTQLNQTQPHASGSAESAPCNSEQRPEASTGSGQTPAHTSSAESSEGLRTSLSSREQEDIATGHENSKDPATSAADKSASMHRETSGGVAEGNSRRTSGRPRNSISYDENKWRIRHGPSITGMTVEEKISDLSTSVSVGKPPASTPWHPQHKTSAAKNEVAAPHAAHETSAGPLHTSSSTSSASNMAKHDVHMPCGGGSGGSSSSNIATQQACSQDKPPAVAPPYLHPRSIRAQQPASVSLPAAVTGLPWAATEFDEIPDSKYVRRQACPAAPAVGARCNASRSRASTMFLSLTHTHTRSLARSRARALSLSLCARVCPAWCVPKYACHLSSAQSAKSRHIATSTWRFEALLSVKWFGHKVQRRLGVVTSVNTREWPVVLKHLTAPDIVLALVIILRCKTRVRA